MLLCVNGRKRVSIIATAHRGAAMSPAKDRETKHKVTAFNPGELRLKAASKLQLHTVDAATALSKLWNISPKLDVPMKTFGPDEGELHYNDGSGSIGKLHDVTVTLVRLTNPNTGVVSIQMSLEYFATAEGSRTPDGRSLPGSTSSYDAGREAHNISHAVYFRNAAGGWYTAGTCRISNWTVAGIDTIACTGRSKRMCSTVRRGWPVSMGSGRRVLSLLIVSETHCGTRTARFGGPFVLASRRRKPALLAWLS
jgi:hypothetical protein